ncbi:hypothetical protein B4U80_04740 [Leptotrombidium deliense]|uniref:MULE transposase domain-containing protein n=1 Tax=Leptotrombidium deliense TaxID=299467 RepID=A0A443RIT0_9ACAR|nr:hypothetical protein B4U80_04740 [Leptotrombidium deliense]
MPNHTTETYCRVLDAIMFSRPHIKPMSILTDFELPAINAFKDQFADIERHDGAL